MKNVKISATLGLISLVCALLIALVNMVSRPIIDTNEQKTELATCQEIFKDYDQDESNSNVDLTGKDSRIKKIIVANDKTGNLLGKIYKVSGNNAYGIITLMVGIDKDNNVCQVEFLENGQSFASTVNNHVSTKYPSSESTDVHIGFYKQGDSSSKPAILDEATLSSIDVKCGATYGATLVKELVTLALNDAKEAA